MSRLGEFFALLRIKPRSTLVQVPNQFLLSFNLAVVLPRRINGNCSTEGGNPPTLSTHRLRRGLPGYLILFATHAFEPQRQLQTRESPSPPGVPPYIYAFHRYTWNSTPLLPQVPSFQ